MSIYGIQRVVALFLRGNHGGCRFEKLRTTMVELRAVRWQIHLVFCGSLGKPWLLV